MQIVIPLPDLTPIIFFYIFFANLAATMLESGAMSRPWPPVETLSFQGTLTFIIYLKTHLFIQVTMDWY